MRLDFGQLTYTHLLLACLLGLLPFLSDDKRDKIKVHNLDSDVWRFASILFLLLDSNYNKSQVLLSLKVFPLALVLFSVVLPYDLFVCFAFFPLGLPTLGLVIPPSPLISQNHLV